MAKTKQAKTKKTKVAKTIKGLNKARGMCS